jgi:hypothetical protein
MATVSGRWAARTGRLRSSTTPAFSDLDREVQIELRIVESGIRRDEGRAAAAAVALQVPELTDGRLRPWSPGCSTPTPTRCSMRAGRGGAGLVWPGSGSGC